MDLARRSADGVAPVVAGEFARTVGVPAASADAVMPCLSELTAEVFAVCLDRFPGAARYRHRIEKDRGVVQGHRFHVERNGFRGVVSVQWYARAHSYREAKDSGLEVRIGGRARLLPVWSAPALPELDAHVHGRVLGLGIAATLGVGGVQGISLVLRNPSWFPAVDVLGITTAILAIFAALYLLRNAMHGAWWTRRPRVLGPASPEQYAGDLTRWRALSIDVDQLSLPGHPPHPDPAPRP